MREEEKVRIRAEMDGVMQDAGWTGTFAEFLNFLRTDPRFYAKTPDQLLKEAAARMPPQRAWPSTTMCLTLRA